jgi:class 3 adenylate cyclase
MTLPTDSQWARYSALRGRLEPCPAAERAAALQALRAEGEDPQILSLLAVHWSLPPDSSYDRRGERLGNFTLEERLGAGGMGVVYRAQQHLGSVTRPVALKLIHPALLATAQDDALARFRAEIGMLVKLEHDGIARIYDAGIQEDPHTHAPLPYIAMELVRSGLPLTTYVRDHALSWQKRLALFLCICRAVQYAHENGIVHRDLKPANILVDAEGRPVVIDFGLAYAYDAVLPGALLVSGTPAYMSPEQVSVAFGTVSAKSDVYALGLMLYELLTDQPLYVLPRDGSVEQWRRVITETPPPPLRQYRKEYGGELDALVTGALAKRPAARLSVAELRVQLEQYLQGLPLEVDHPHTPEAEWRQLTVLACRLVSGAAPAAPLDNEVRLEVMRDYRAICTEVMHRFDGPMPQYQGIELVGYFGYLQAHEDDARRAVLAGLGLVEGMAELTQRLKRDWGVPLAIQVGIHTSLEVVEGREPGDRREPLILGDTRAIATQLQDLAAPNTVLISQATWRLVDRYFVYEALGTRMLEDATEPLAVYRVLQESPDRNHPTGLTPFVGREPEVALLYECWAQAKEGTGQVIVLRGEAGIGKSRLVQVFTDHLAGEACTHLEYHCSPYYQHTALYPIMTTLQRLLHFSPEETTEEQLCKLEGLLTRSGIALAEGVPLWATLLSLPLPARYPPLTLTAQLQRQKTLETLLAWLLHEAEQQPVCVLVEDLHWADASTVEWLGLLINQVPTTRLLLLLACRPEFSLPWVARTHLSQVTLRRLSRQHVETMVQRITGGKALPPELLHHLVATTDGVPLFVEELTKMVLESGLIKEREGRYELTGSLSSLAIPATLHDSLMARLDRLGPAKQVAQLGAMQGREFSYELLQAVVPLEETTLQHGLSQLVEAELLYQRGLPPQTRYQFKHALIQDAAYHSMLRSTRRHHHSRIAQIMEARFPDTCTRHPELVAHHYMEAGLSAQAIPYWQQAGQRAIERSANLEAISNLTKGLELLKTLPDTPERAQQELTMQLTLGAPLSAIKGYAAPEVEHTYSRARDLCQQIGDSPHLFSALGGLGRFYLNRAQLQTAHEFGERFFTLVQPLQDPALLPRGARDFRAGLVLHRRTGLGAYAPGARYRTL